MKQVPIGTELARPFLPAKDFAVSKDFYETLGFEKLLDEDVAIFKAGSSTFILQNYYKKEWAENFMMQLMVDDLDAWWAHIDGLDLPVNSTLRPRAHQPHSHGAFGSLMLSIHPECFGTWQNAAMVQYTTKRAGCVPHSSLLA